MLGAIFLGKDFHKVSADLCLLLEASYVSLGLNCQGWPMCSIYGWYRDCNQQTRDLFLDHFGYLKAQSQVRIENGCKKRNLGHRTWIRMQNHFTRRNFTPSSENAKLSRQTQVPKSIKDTTELLGISNLLLKSQSLDGWETQPFVNANENSNTS